MAFLNSSKAIGSSDAAGHRWGSSVRRDLSGRGDDATSACAALFLQHVGLPVTNFRHCTRSPIGEIMVWIYGPYRTRTRRATQRLVRRKTLGLQAPANWERWLLNARITSCNRYRITIKVKAGLELRPLPPRRHGATLRRGRRGMAGRHGHARVRERVGTAGLAIGMRSDLDAMVSLARSENPRRSMTLTCGRASRQPTPASSTPSC